MRASTALVCLACVGAMSAGCTLLNSGDDLLRDSGVRADVPMGPGDAFVVGEDACSTEKDDLTCTDGVDNDCDGQRDCEDSNCSGIAGCPTTCSVPGDCGAAETCVAMVCVPTFDFTVSVMDGATPIRMATIKTYTEAGTQVGTWVTDGGGEARVTAVPGGYVTASTASLSIRIDALPAELRNETIHLSDEISSKRMLVSVVNDRPVDVRADTGCDAVDMLVVGASTGLNTSGHCSAPHGPFVLGCATSSPESCTLVSAAGAEARIAPPPSPETYGLNLTDAVPSALAFRIGNAVLGLPWTGSGARPTWALPDISDTGIIAQMEIGAVGGNERVVYATDVPGVYDLPLGYPTPWTVTSAGGGVTWTAPTYLTKAPDYYIFFSGPDRRVVPGDTTSLDGTYDGALAVWDSRRMFTGSPYAGAIRYAGNNTLENGTVQATALATIL